MDTFFTALFFTSLFLLLHGLSGRILSDKLHLSDPFVSLLFGILIGPHILGLLSTPYILSKEILFYASKAVLCLQTMACALSLPRKYVENYHTSISVLVFAVGFISYLFTTTFVYTFSRYSLMPSLAIAAALTPTDPVLCSSLLSKWKGMRPDIKHLLIAESGLNDGFGLFLILAPLLIQKKAYLQLIIVILWKGVCGLLIGYMIGCFAKVMLKTSFVSEGSTQDSALAFTVALVLLLLGLSEIIGISELCCVFGCGLAIRNIFKRQLDGTLQTVVDTACTKALFVLLGSRIDLNAVTIRLCAFSFLIIVIRRILIILMIRKAVPLISAKKEALIVGWLGPVGIGAIYYALYYDHIAGTTTHVAVSAVVMISVFIHALVTVGMNIHEVLDQSGFRHILGISAQNRQQNEIAHPDTKRIGCHMNNDANILFIDTRLHKSDKDALNMGSVSLERVKFYDMSPTVIKMGKVRLNHDLCVDNSRRIHIEFQGRTTRDTYMIRDRLLEDVALEVSGSDGDQVPYKRPASDPNSRASSENVSKFASRVAAGISTPLHFKKNLCIDLNSDTLPHSSCSDAISSSTYFDPADFTFLYPENLDAKNTNCLSH